jgi:hypothetical protein
MKFENLIAAADENRGERRQLLAIDLHIKNANRYEESLATLIEETIYA